jgi:hypothetical protein
MRWVTASGVRHFSLHGPVRGKRAKDDPEIAMVNALDTLRIAA